MPSNNPQKKTATDNEQLEDIELPLKDVQSRYDEIIGSLTLFAPLSHEQEKLSKKSKLGMERPVTPIEEEVKAAPATLNNLQRLVRRRVQPRSAVPCLSDEEQRELAGIIMGEVNSIWPDLKEQIEYPFFTYEQNRELNRRITVHIVTVCTELYKHYLAKAELLKKRGVFSEEANVVRLRTQLAFDCRKYLNVLTVRRYISAEMKGVRHTPTPSETCIYPEIQSVKDVSHLPSTAKMEDATKLTMKHLIELNTQLTHKAPSDIPRAERHRFKTLKEDLKELKRAMPDLDTEKLEPLLRNLPRNLSSLARRSATPRSSITDKKSKHEPGRESALAGVTFDGPPKVMTRSSSEPSLQVGPNLLDELEIYDPIWFPYNEVDERLINHSFKTEEQLKEEKTLHFDSNITKETLRKDLLSLQKREAPTACDEEEDLPPLIQMNPKISADEDRRKKLKEKLHSLQEREKKTIEEEKFIPRQPTHPQPATLTRNIGNNFVIRTSDIRPSERQCLSEITLPLFKPVWNDLLDEIDAATVKMLDRNLFRGEEIREVYKEIMKTVPRDHMDFTKDPIVEACPDELDVSACLASSTLRRRRKRDRVINPDIHKSTAPPWGSQTLTDWGKAPVFTPGEKKKAGLSIEDVVDNIMKTEANNITTGLQRTNSEDMRSRTVLGMDVNRTETPHVPRRYVLSLDDFMAGLEDSPKGVQERLTRNYASWLQWWRDTMSAEDYLKFLSTHETDYLSLLFHLYDSDGEDDPEPGTDAAAKQAILEKQKKRDEERQKKVTELKAEKTKFESGMWNAQAVFMGGLGGDPEVDEPEQEEDIALTTQEEDSASQDKKRTGSFIGLRSTLTTTSPQGDGTSSGGGLEPGLTAVSRDQSKMGVGTGVGVEDQGVSGDGLELTSQERLERLWGALKMPDHQRLNMAVKYCNAKYAPRLEEALRSWENATQCVLQREAIIAQLEDFERHASDPNRYFERGYRGSSVARMDEARTRRKLHKKLEALDDLAREAVLSLEIDFQDALTYEGRPYLDKMKWDRTEMLYWLQEERRTFVVSNPTMRESRNFHLPSIVSPNVPPPPVNKVN